MLCAKLKKILARVLYSDIRLGQGKENAKEFLKENLPIADEIDGKIRECLMTGILKLPDTMDEIVAE